MEEIVTILSTREWAITIWGTGFFIWMLTQSEIRKSLWNVIKILLGKNLRRFFLIIALYVAGITMIFYQLPFWNNIYLKDIILWLIFSGISYCVNSIIKGDTEHLKSTVKYHCEMDEHCTENVINMMTNEFPTSAAKKTYAQCVFLKKEQDDYGISDSYEKMLQNPEFCAILEELVDFGISRYKVNYSYHYQDTNLVLYQKYTYEDACRLLNWERNEVPLNIGGYKYDKKTKTFPIFINYDKQDNISDTTKYEDHFVAENRLIAISKSGRSMDSEDVQNFLNATERGIDVQLFVRKNKDDKISKEFYYLGRVIATGNAKQFVMPNTDKTAVEIEWELETPVREDIYQYIVNE